MKASLLNLAMSRMGLAGSPLKPRGSIYRGRFHGQRKGDALAAKLRATQKRVRRNRLRLSNHLHAMGNNPILMRDPALKQRVYDQAVEQTLTSQQLSDFKQQPGKAAA